MYFFHSPPPPNKVSRRNSALVFHRIFYSMLVTNANLYELYSRYKAPSSDALCGSLRLGSHYCMLQLMHFLGHFFSSKCQMHFERHQLSNSKIATKKSTALEKIV